ncbi:Citrinin biosynthesis transcriptional activator mrl3 [Fusarium oxysporum f. sp. rapae]|uniref:Citrinin biosynthesis transcriptional activator mrl3 n=1 Tax=Fusarium oxysporum f. sp. rapae TaxID=485398 RepID=A0A8J5TR71_FUSOX|nr:Citrinin biosynthesis transcriptional activator mrl3 [Fusarium oxysporum f. sp. rapae]
MWIIAILLSTQFRELIEPLYTQVKKDLESSGSFEVEHAQSWTLLTVCELMRASYSQAWISAGRMFRLVQGLRSYEIDSPDKVHSSKEDSTRTEEKRRVFWMAYLLDHLFGMRNDWPVTLSEHMCMPDDCHRRISIATEEIIRLARGLTHLHFSQVHPLMSMPLFAAAEFLYEYRDLKDGAFLQQLRDLMDVLGNLKNVNDYEKSYLDLLPRSCISASLDVLRHGEEQRNS